MSTTVDVAVIGGGIAGLAAAYELRLRGLDVRVLEASERPGGVVHTERFDGWVIDAGPDALLVQKPAGVALCRELGLGDRLVSTRLPAYRLRAARRIAAAIGGGVFPGLSHQPRCACPIASLHLAWQAAHGVRSRRAPLDGRRRVDLVICQAAFWYRGA